MLHLKLVNHQVIYEYNGVFFWKSGIPWMFHCGSYMIVELLNVIEVSLFDFLPLQVQPTMVGPLIHGQLV